MNLKPDIKQVEGVSISIGDGAMTLSREEAIKLSTLSEHPGYKPLRDLLKSMLDSTTVVLRDKANGIEDVRYQQGVASAVIRIAEIMDRDLPEWYKEGSREGSGQEDA